MPILRLPNKHRHNSYSLPEGCHLSAAQGTKAGMFDVFSPNNLYFSFFFRNFAPIFDNRGLLRNSFAAAKVTKNFDIRKYFSFLIQKFYKIWHLIAH